MSRVKKDRDKTAKALKSIQELNETKRLNQMPKWLRNKEISKKKHQ